jgi:hypothetical protein
MVKINREKKLEKKIMLVLSKNKSKDLILSKQFVSSNQINPAEYKQAFWVAIFHFTLTCFSSKKIIDLFQLCRIDKTAFWILKSPSAL